MEHSSSPGRRQRVSDAERDQVAKHLGDAYAEGRLDLDEFDRRNSAAYEAVFDDELLDLVTDLPAPGEGAATPHSVPSTVEQDEVVELTNDSGVLRRRGDWVVPRRLRVTSRSGSVRLDMSEARIAHPVVEIELEMYSGATVLVLPEGCTANLDGLRMVYANERSKVSAAPRTGVPHFVLTGHAFTGAVRIRQARGRKR